MTDIKKKAPKAERMRQHVMDSCLASGKPQDTCNAEAAGVVNKWKDNQKQHRANTSTPMTKK